ncbi:translation initiation factor IF-2 [Oryctolagus cuniculus]|uniref:translation initiation factor IF-2 n=1 Tax=Oryctolagus cuniculus TaxID=9986 RepID=UPI00387968D7
MAAGPGVQGRRRGGIRGNLAFRAPRRPSRPSLPGPHSRPLPPGKPAVGSTSPSPLAPRAAEGWGSPPAAARAWGSSRGLGTAADPRPTSPGRPTSPEKRPSGPIPNPPLAPGPGAPAESAGRVFGGPGRAPGKGRPSGLPDPAPEPAAAPAASPGLPEAVRSAPAAAQGLSSGAPRLLPRPPRGPAPGSGHSPLPRRAAAGLPHVTREQLRPESPGPARGGPSPPPSGSHVAPRPAGQRPRPPREGSDGRALQAPWGPHGAPTSVPARGRTAGPSAAWFPLALGAAEEAGEGRKRGRWVAGSCPRSRRRVASSATSGIEPLPPAPAPALSLQREPWAAWDWVGQNKHVQGVSQILSEGSSILQGGEKAGGPLPRPPHPSRPRQGGSLGSLPRRRSAKVCAPLAHGSCYWGRQQGRGWGIQAGGTLQGRRRSPPLRCFWTCLKTTSRVLGVWVHTEAVKGTGGEGGPGRVQKQSPGSWPGLCFPSPRQEGCGGGGARGLKKGVVISFLPVPRLDARLVHPGEEDQSPACSLQATNQALSWA